MKMCEKLTPSQHGTGLTPLHTAVDPDRGSHIAAQSRMAKEGH
jgi:hypothetical protein